MNLKERIIRSKITRLDPDRDAAQIERLKARIAAPTPPPVLEEKKDPETPPPPVEKRSVPTVADVENFRALNAEVHIRSRKWGDIWLVPRRTGADRFEILPEEIDFLSLILEKFSARIIGVEKNVKARL